jgi:two-component system sensor histidine kinase YesM
MSAEKTAELNRKIRCPEHEGPTFALTAVTDGRAHEERKGSGIGLRNVHQRLQLFYGHEYGLWVESEEGIYTRVLMKIPRHNFNGGES